jgi:hypothetical protein
MIDGSDRIRANPRVEHRELTTGEAVLLHLDTAAYHGMNPTGALIWSSIGEESTFAELVAVVRAALEDPPETLEDDVATFVQSLAVRDLLTVTSDAAPTKRPGA